MPVHLNHVLEHPILSFHFIFGPNFLIECAGNRAGDCILSLVSGCHVVTNVHIYTIYGTRSQSNFARHKLNFLPLENVVEIIDHDSGYLWKTCMLIR